MPETNSIPYRDDASLREAQRRKSTKLLYLSYGLTAVGFVVGIALSWLALAYPDSKNLLAAFEIAVISSLFFAVSSFFLSHHFVLDAVRANLERLEGVDCRLIGDNEAGVRYTTERYRDHSRKLIRIRDTHVRFSEHYQHYSTSACQLIKSGLEEFLSRPGTQLTVLLGSTVDKDYADSTISAAKNRQAEDRVACYGLNSDAPLMNFTILDYADAASEVVFGWGRQGPDPTESVFRSVDPHLVEEYSNLFGLLCNEPVSTRVPLEDVLGIPRTQGRVSAARDWPKLYDLLKDLEIGAGPGEHDVMFVTSFFTGWSPDFIDTLRALLVRGARIRIVVMNPDNDQLLHARFGLREDAARKADAVKRSARRQIEFFKTLADNTLGCQGTLEIQTSDIMPPGYVVHTKNWVVFGPMPATLSYRDAPMIYADSGSWLWRAFDRDWKPRWADAVASQKFESVAPPRRIDGQWAYRCASGSEAWGGDIDICTVAYSYGIVVKLVGHRRWDGGGRFDGTHKDNMQPIPWIGGGAFVEQGNLEWQYETSSVPLVRQRPNTTVTRGATRVFDFVPDADLAQQKGYSAGTIMRMSGRAIHEQPQGRLVGGTIEMIRIKSLAEYDYEGQGGPLVGLPRKNQGGLALSAESGA